MIFRILILIFLSGFKLSMPVDCEYGVDCFIQNYVDIDKSGNHKDRECGNLSYNGHKGTDFRLRNYVDMYQGVYVLAAADGKVLRVRNNVKDIRYPSNYDVKGKECGNGLVISHGEYETKYCHLMKGSIIVNPSQKVKAGDIIGKIGLSGKTQFPHLHFGLTKNNKIIEPFGDSKCSLGANYWDNSLDLEYIKTAILGVGLTDQFPEAENARKGIYSYNGGDNLIIWVDIMGVYTGDKIVLKFKNQKKELIFQTKKEIESNKVLFFMYAGKKNIGKLPNGVYEIQLNYISKDKVLNLNKKFVINDQEESKKSINYILRK